MTDTERFAAFIKRATRLYPTAIAFVYNPALKDKVPEAGQKAVEEAKAKILAGELKVLQTYLTENR